MPRTIDQQLKAIWSRVAGDYFQARIECGLPEAMPGKDVREVVDDNAFGDKQLGEAWEALTNKERDKHLLAAFPHEEYL